MRILCIKYIKNIYGCFVLCFSIIYIANYWARNVRCKLLLCLLSVRGPAAGLLVSSAVQDLRHWPRVGRKRRPYERNGQAKICALLFDSSCVCKIRGIHEHPQANSWSYVAPNVMLCHGFFFRESTDEDRNFFRPSGGTVNRIRR